MANEVRVEIIEGGQVIGAGFFEPQAHDIQTNNTSGFLSMDKTTHLFLNTLLMMRFPGGTTNYFSITGPISGGYLIVVYGDFH